MNERNRVFVTGHGSISCMEALSLGNLAPAPRPLPQGAHRIGQFDSSSYISDASARRMDRFTLLAYVAVKKALDAAGLAQIPEDCLDRTGVIMSTCYGPLDSTRRYLMKLIRDGAKKVPAAVFPNTVHNAFTGLITMDLKAFGTNSTISGSNPICYGLDMIRDGRDDIMIVGGCDEFVDVMLDGFNPARPGSGGRGELSLGEGAAVLILESERSVRRRGAKVLAEVLDYGMTSGVGGPKVLFPCEQEDVEVAIGEAMRRSNVAAGAIRFVSIAANGVTHVDQAEAAALRSTFGAGKEPEVIDVKRAIGETLGAASVFSSVLAIEALQSLGEEESATALVNSMELGGNFTSLVLGSAGKTESLKDRSH